MAVLAVIPNQASPLVTKALTVTQAWLLYFQALATSAVQTGTVVQYAGIVPPNGYLACNGAAVSRATFSALNSLAAAVNYAAPWGAGNGTMTFNVPNIASVGSIGFVIKS
jgi:hypothetical protein